VRLRPKTRRRLCNGTAASPLTAHNQWEAEEGSLYAWILVGAWTRNPSSFHCTVTWRSEGGAGGGAVVAVPDPRL
jgi:hypothetical protein